METAKQFWQSQTTYPKYGNIKNRRLHELNYLVPKLKDVKSLLDLGCGDGALINCLHHLTDIEKYYGYDIADNLMKGTKAELKHYDCSQAGTLPAVDFIVFAGVIPYLEDDEVDNVLQRIALATRKLYIKAPCSMDKPERISKFSDKLQANYESYYRTIPQMIELISKHFKISDVSRAYPDEIESEFGTKQIIFLCSK